MDRITIKHLRAQCEHLNRITNSPVKPYIPRPDGKGCIAQVGCFIIDQAYGGYQLARIMNEGGGQTAPIGLGFVPARECYNRISAYINGLRDAREAA